MVLNELLLNAVEHGFAEGESGSILIAATRSWEELEVTVADTGRGLPDDFDLTASSQLGLQIVRTLVSGELRGTIRLSGRPGSGTEARLRFPINRAVALAPAMWEMSQTSCRAATRA